MKKYKRVCFLCLTRFDKSNFGGKTTWKTISFMRGRSLMAWRGTAKTDRDRDIYKNVNQQIDMYRLFLDQNFAADEKYEWYKEQKKLLNELKREKDDITSKKPAPSAAIGRKSLIEKTDSENPGMEYVKVLEEEIKDALGKVQAGTEKAVEISTYIKLQLHRQIEVLDDVYQQNIDMDSRLNRVKKGLMVILRRAMMNKCTRFLAVLLLVALIGLIVVWILNGKGLI